ncbi:MAG: AbrB/MazE/SpoVT family DNA-binding domain-containing protein [Candidatus Saccharibacteria bacterium]|nr:AbrB/MazE/SpoVT family DNA-binding domain-containing protein [Candidatus Saccharibacteria bacterium]
MARPENDQTGKRKLNMVGGKTYAVSLPVEIVKQLKWVKGQNLIVRRQGAKIIIEQGEI